MAAYELCTGQILYLISSSSEESDPLKVEVRLESMEAVRLSDFVHDAAIRWKKGEISVFKELLSLLLQQLRTRVLHHQEGEQHQGEDAVHPEHEEILDDDELALGDDLSEDEEEDNDRDYNPLNGCKKAPRFQPRNTKLKNKRKRKLRKNDGENSTEADIKPEPFLVKPEVHGTEPPSVRRTAREKTCEVCEEVFPRELELRLHIGTFHADLKRFKCLVCSLETEEKQVMEEHLIHLHAEQFSALLVQTRSDKVLNIKKFKKPLNRVSCDKCGLTFCSRNSLNTHRRSVHENLKDYACKICCSEFTTVSGVKRHIEIHHGVDPTKEDYENLNKERKQAPAPAVCALCHTDCGSSDGLVDHVVAAHPTQPHLFPAQVQSHGPLPWSRAEAWERSDWSCPLCPSHMMFRTETLNGMVSHVKLGHPTSIMCWVCGMGWTNQQGKLVFEHMKEQHALKSVFACAKCGVYNQSRKLLSNHRKIHRMEELQGPLLSCDQCDYVTPRPDILAKHRFSHRSSKHYMCDDCGKVLKSRTALATHAKLHVDDKRNQCSICFKVFSQRGYLKTHMNSHSDSKPYSCEFCAMTFFGPTNLSQHRKRTHGDMIGESPKLACTLCPKRFWIPSELKYHRERVHEGKKDFACPECEKRFADKKNLKKHIVNVHKLGFQQYVTG